MKTGEKRIALFFPSLHGGGAERVMLNLAWGLVNKGVNVDLVLTRAEGAFAQQIPKGVRVFDLKASRAIASLPGLVGYLRRETPYALLSAIDHNNVVAVMARKIARVPVRLVVSVHGTLSKSAAHASSLRGRLMPLWVRLAYPHADAVVAVSDGVAQDLVASAGIKLDKLKVIYNPVVTPDILIKAEEEVEHPWFRNGEPPIILGVGRLALEKDFCTLIKAFALVRKKYNARLVILGEGEERPRLEALARELSVSDEVFMPGFVQNPYKYMKRAGVFVLSSQWEGFGNVLVEAMAVGTPVVSTDCPSGPAEILENGRWGEIVPVGDVEALAEGIIRALHEPRGRAVVRAKEFSCEKIVAEYMKVLGI